MRDVSRLETADPKLALVVSVVGFAVYGATLQDWYYGDGPQLINRFAQSIEDGRLDYWMHVLYTPAGYLVERALPGYHPILALKLLSAFSCSIALGGAFLLARCFGVSRTNASAAAVMWMVTPASWFFGTTIEVHGLHAAAVATCACITVLAPWRKPWLAVAISCAAFPLVYLTHRTGLLLGPAFVLLAQFARIRATGVGFRWRALVFGVGVAHLASLMVAMLVGQVLYGGAADLGVTSTLTFVEDLYRGFSVRLLTSGILYPFAFVIPLVVLGWFGRERLERWLLIAAVLPITLMFLFVFGDPTEGGYFLGVAPFLVVLGGHGLDRWKGPMHRWTVAVLLVCQVAAGVQRVRFSGYEHLGPERVARAERTHDVLPDGGVVVSLDFESQTISGMYEGLREVNLLRVLEIARTTQTPARFAAHMREMPKTFGNALAFDLGYRRDEDRKLLPQLVSYADAAFAALERNGPAKHVTVRGREFLLLK